MFTDINNYPINNKTDHILEKYIFIEKKVQQKLILVGFGVGSGSGSIISLNGSEDPDPYQNETHPKHWLIRTMTVVQGEFIKSVGEQYQDMTRGRKCHGCGEEYNVEKRERGSSIIFSIIFRLLRRI